MDFMVFVFLGILLSLGKKTHNALAATAECLRSGVYADPNDCTKFYMCSSYGPVLFNCPDGLDFNPTLLVCDWPETAGCILRRANTTAMPLPTTISTNTETNTTENVRNISVSSAHFLPSQTSADKAIILNVTEIANLTTVKLSSTTANRIFISTTTEANNATTPSYTSVISDGDVQTKPEIPPETSTIEPVSPNLDIDKITDNGEEFQKNTTGADSNNLPNKFTESSMDLTSLNDHINEISDDSHDGGKSMSPELFIVKTTAAVSWDSTNSISDMDVEVSRPRNISIVSSFNSTPITTDINDSVTDDYSAGEKEEITNPSMSTNDSIYGSQSSYVSSGYITTSTKSNVSDASAVVTKNVTSNIPDENIEISTSGSRNTAFSKYTTSSTYQADSGKVTNDSSYVVPDDISGRSGTGQEELEGTTFSSDSSDFHIYISGYQSYGTKGSDVSDHGRTTVTVESHDNAATITNNNKDLGSTSDWQEISRPTRNSKSNDDIINNDNSTENINDLETAASNDFPIDNRSTYLTKTTGNIMDSARGSNFTKENTNTAENINDSVKASYDDITGGSGDRKEIGNTITSTDNNIYLSSDHSNANKYSDLTTKTSSINIYSNNTDEKTIVPTSISIHTEDADNAPIHNLQTNTPKSRSREDLVEDSTTLSDITEPNDLSSDFDYTKDSSDIPKNGETSWATYSSVTDGTDAGLTEDISSLMTASSEKTPDESYDEIVSRNTMPAATSSKGSNIDNHHSESYFDITSDSIGENNSTASIETTAKSADDNNENSIEIDQTPEYTRDENTVTTYEQKLSTVFSTTDNTHNSFQTESNEVVNQTELSITETMNDAGISTESSTWESSSEGITIDNRSSESYFETNSSSIDEFDFTATNEIIVIPEHSSDETSIEKDEISEYTRDETESSGTVTMQEENANIVSSTTENSDNSNETELNDYNYTVTISHDSSTNDEVNHRDSSSINTINKDDISNFAFTRETTYSSDKTESVEYNDSATESQTSGTDNETLDQTDSTNAVTKTDEHISTISSAQETIPKSHQTESIDYNDIVTEYNPSNTNEETASDNDISGSFTSEDTNRTYQTESVDYTNTVMVSSESSTNKEAANQSESSYSETKNADNVTISAAPDNTPNSYQTDSVDNDPTVTQSPTRSPSDETIIRTNPSKLKTTNDEYVSTVFSASESTDTSAQTKTIDINNSVTVSSQSSITVTVDEESVRTSTESSHISNQTDLNGRNNTITKPSENSWQLRTETPTIEETSSSKSSKENRGNASTKPDSVDNGSYDNGQTSETILAITTPTGTAYTKKSITSTSNKESLSTSDNGKNLTVATVVKNYTDSSTELPTKTDPNHITDISPTNNMNISSSSVEISSTYRTQSITNKFTPAVTTSTSTTTTTTEQPISSTDSAIRTTKMNEKLSTMDSQASHTVTILMDNSTSSSPAFHNITKRNDSTEIPSNKIDISTPATTVSSTYTTQTNPPTTILSSDNTRQPISSTLSTPRSTTVKDRLPTTEHKEVQTITTLKTNFTSSSPEFITTTDQSHTTPSSATSKKISPSATVISSTHTTQNIINGITITTTTPRITASTVPATTAKEQLPTSQPVTSSTSKYPSDQKGNRDDNNSSDDSHKSDSGRDSDEDTDSAYEDTDSGDSSNSKRSNESGDSNVSEDSSDSKNRSDSDDSSDSNESNDSANSDDSDSRQSNDSSGSENSSIDTSDEDSRNNNSNKRIDGNHNSQRHNHNDKNNREKHYSKENHRNSKSDDSDNKKHNNRNKKDNTQSNNNDQRHNSNQQENNHNINQKNHNRSDRENNRNPGWNNESGKPHRDDSNRDWNGKNDQRNTNQNERNNKQNERRNKQDQNKDSKDGRKHDRNNADQNNRELDQNKNNRNRNGNMRNKNYDKRQNRNEQKSDDKYKYRNDQDRTYWLDERRESKRIISLRSYMEKFKDAKRSNKGIKVEDFNENSKREWKKIEGYQSDIEIPQIESLENGISQNNEETLDNGIHEREIDTQQKWNNSDDEHMFDENYTSFLKKLLISKKEKKLLKKNLQMYDW